MLLAREEGHIGNPGLKDVHFDILAKDEPFYLEGSNPADRGTQNRLERVFSSTSGPTVMLAPQGEEIYRTLIEAMAFGMRQIIRTCSPLGAAMHGAAAGRPGGGHDMIGDATQQMAHFQKLTYKPRVEEASVTPHRRHGLPRPLLH